MSSEEQRQKDNEGVRQMAAVAANGNQEALQYLLNVARYARDIDDLVDGDHSTTVDKKDVVGALLFELGRDPFRCAHPSVILVEMNVFVSWIASHKDELDKRVAFFAKEQMAQLFISVAFICGDYDLAKKVADGCYRTMSNDLKVEGL